MATIIHRTSERFSGIWLLDDDALKAFDEVVEEEWNRLQQKTEQNIRQEIENEIIRRQNKEQNLTPDRLDDLRQEIRIGIEKHYPYTKKRRTLTIYLASGQKLPVSSFKEAFENPDINCQMPKEFNLKINTESVDCEVEMEKNKISIRVSPDDIPEASTIFLKFEQWAKRFRSPLPLYWWKEFRFLLLWCLLLFIFFLGLSAGILYQEKDQFKKEAEILLKDGISEAEIPRAIGLMLSKVYGVTPTSTDLHLKPWFKVFLPLAVILLIICCFPPTSTIGIGEGVNSVRRQKKMA
jgi:hypothetical protein